jgi:ABC-2 type transport system ATP-binding protein
MQVNDVLVYLARLKGKSKLDAQKNIDHWLERFFMSDWKKKKIHELSKGMSQKIQFIATIAHDPDLIFLDEPFSGLDPVSVDVMKEVVLDLAAKNKIILLSTHSMEQAEKLCNSIFLINHGKEVLSGKLDDIKSDYGNKSVIIEFAGNSNVIEETSLVSKINKFPRWVEAELNDRVSADELLQAIVGKISITKFELSTPSLHKIFVSRVGKNIEL